jgi:hypothetical protein
MRLLLALAASLFLVSCTQESKPFSVPPATEGGWKLTSTGETPGEFRPEWMDRMGRKKSQTAVYAGPIDVSADFHEMSSDASALECTQVWRRAPGQACFHLRNLFIVIRSNHPNKEMTMDFSRALQKALS